jgi:hypothetical protein
MKSLAILIAVGLVGCAAPYQTRPAHSMSYQEIESIKVVDSRDCRDPDNLITEMYRQLQLKGFLGKNPEDLATDEDRRYNSRAKVVIWSLRIGCNNPDRYK